jgi:putative effector of murein hydrolase
MIDLSFALNTVARSDWLWIGATLLSFHIGTQIYKRTGKVSVFQPVIVGLVLVIAAVSLSGTSYQHYAISTQPLYLALGVVTVALAVPLYNHFGLIRKAMMPLAVTLVLGGLVTSVTAVAIGWLAGCPPELLWSLSVKTITGPFAMLVSEAVGGYAALAALIVLITGIVSVIVTPPIFKLLDIDDERIIGFTLGTMGHGIGTAAAFDISNRCGAFAALGMSLMGVTVAVCVPIIAGLI